MKIKDIMGRLRRRNMMRFVSHCILRRAMAPNGVERQQDSGRVAEWLKALVLKTSDGPQIGRFDRRACAPERRRLRRRPAGRGRVSGRVIPPLISAYSA